MLDVNTTNNITVKDEPTEVSIIRDTILNTFNGLVFKEEEHRYFLGEEELISVSHLTHQFVPPFDDEKVAENYAIKHGETKEYWLDKWKYTSLCSTTTGTLVHSYGESMAWLRNGHPELITDDCKMKYIKDKGWLIPTRKKEEAVLKFWDELHPSLHFVLAETKVYSGINKKIPKYNQNYAGTFDLLMYYKDENDDSKSGLIIMDYKTNAQLEKEFSRKYGKMMLPPFDKEYFNESLSAYTLQLSAYQIALEDIGLKVVGRRLIWLKDDGTYELIKVNNETNRLRAVI